MPNHFICDGNFTDAARVWGMAIIAHLNESVVAVESVRDCLEIGPIYDL